MFKRKFPVDKEKAKRIKKKLKEARNNTERVRITAIVEYLKGKNTLQVSEGLGVSHGTVSGVLRKYEELGEDEFYKTNYKGPSESEEHKEVREEIIKMIEECEEELDINDIKERLEKQGKRYDYHKVWWLVRQRMGYNYQKPYVTNSKQSEHAKEIIKGRLRKAVYEVALEEKKIDAEAIKNKKTKIGGNE